jgi:pimeloyl-ACP methyl ester carboxylesterase
MRRTPHEPDALGAYVEREGAESIEEDVEMGEYVDVAGLKTWYDTAGEGYPLVLLHGGLCTNETWGAQMPAFAERFQVVAPERRAHGHTADVEGPLNFSDMAMDTIGFLETVVKQPAHLVGWSDGGIIGLLVAIQRPDLVRKLVSISANTNTGGVVPEAHDQMLGASPDDPSLEMFRSLYAASSPDGPDHWPIVFAKFGEMASTQPDIKIAELARIKAPTLVVSGDDDIVMLEHTVELYRAIPGSELAVVPGTSHALVFEKPDLLNRIVIDFLENDPPATVLPVRRAVR